MSRFISFWRNLLRRDRVERDLDDEVRGAFESIVEELMAAGMSSADARRAAALQFGRVDSVKSQVRDARAGAFWDPLRLDVRFGFRLLVRSPVFTTFAVASLALGIGATGAIFTLFDGLVLRKLAVPEPERLVVASFGGAGGSFNSGGDFNYSLPYPQFEQINQRNTTLAGLFATNPFGRVTVAARGEPAIAEGLYVTGDYYRVLGLAPSVGRLIQPADDRPGEAVAVLSHAYWQRRFGGRAEVVGTAVTLNNVPFTIVGVEPAGFYGTEVGRPYDISVPMRARDALNDGDPLWNEAFATWIYVMGRLAPSVTLQGAEAEIKTIFAQVSMDGARTPTQVRLARENQLRLEPAATGAESGLRRTHERWLRLLLMVLGAVLLLASLNLATLLLSRSDARQREISTRLALGAGRARIIRQLLTESMVLATLGGVFGLALASWASRLLLRMATPGSDRPPLELTPNLRLVLFTIAVSAAMCLLYGLIPALRGTLSRRLVIGQQVGSGSRRRVIDHVLVAAQVALSLVLLAGAGLFLRTLGQLWAQDPGYDRRNLLMFSVDARLAGHDGPNVPLSYRRLLEELRTVRGARLVTASAVRPVSDTYYLVSSVRQIGDRSLPDEQRIRVAFNHIAPGYFAALGIPFVAGRDFEERDSPDAVKVVIVSERMARHFTGNAIGQHLGDHEVVGVVKDIRYANIKDAPREVLYFPLFQAQPRELFYSPSFEIRYAGGIPDILSSVRAAVSRVDPGLQIFRVRTLEEQTQDSLSRERVLALLTSYIGGFAVLLACIGLYGLTSYAVTLRTAEIGLRMALGADSAAVRWMIVREATLTVVAGTVAGFMGTLGAVRLVRNQLFGIQPHDTIALASATALLLAMALVAAYLPARRASRIDPLNALRHE
jgi:predicted permease